MAVKFDKDVQKLLIEMLLSEPSLFTRAAPILEAKYFHIEFQETIRLLHEHSKQYSSLPTYEQIKAQTKLHYNKLNELLNINNQLAALDLIEGFCKHRAIELAVLECAERINEGKPEGIEKIVKDATLISLQRDLGINYFDDPRARMERLKDEQGELSTGWASVDKILFGGFGWGELNIFVAPTGGGKSVALQNMSRMMIDRAVGQGLNVIYVTLELKEELVAKRIDGQFTNIPLHMLNKRIDEVETAITLKSKSKGIGALQLKYMRPQSTTLDLEAYINEYEIRTGIIPNIIIVDYLDLLRPSDKSISAGDFFMKDKLVSEELRAMAADRTKIGKKTTVISASQVNRCLVLDTVVITPSGEKTMADLKIGDKVLSVSGWNNVMEKTPTTQREVYKITTESGKVIYCTDNHIFPVGREEKSIETGLCVGDELVINKVETIRKSNRNRKTFLQSRYAINTYEEE